LLDQPEKKSDKNGEADATRLIAASGQTKKRDGFGFRKKKKARNQKRGKTTTDYYYKDEENRIEKERNAQSHPAHKGGGGERKFLLWTLCPNGGGPKGKTPALKGTA